MHTNDTESPCGWYILHRIRTPSGKIETPETWVTLCKENNEPGDYITTTAKDISLTGPVKRETFDVPVVVQIESSSKEDSVERVLSFLEYAQNEGNYDGEIKGCYIGADIELTVQKGGAIPVDSNPKPSFYPFCGTRSIIEIGEWKATSNDDIENTESLIEYQCQGNCQGRSFWI